MVNMAVVDCSPADAPLAALAVGAFTRYPAAAQRGRDPQRVAQLSAAKARALGVIEGSWVTSTIKARKAAATELSNWFDSLPEGAKCGWPTAGPLDLVHYIEDAWLATHGTFNRADGGTGCAPTSLDSVLSHLTTTFTLLGRTGKWASGGDIRRRNPLRSSAVAKYKASFKRLCSGAGYRTGAAKAWAPGEVERVLRVTLPHSKPYTQL